MARCLGVGIALALASCASAPKIEAPLTTSALADAETAFARSMQDRDLATFASFIDDDAVFINGGKPLRGKPAILAHWQSFFVEAPAPFMWKPLIAEVSAANRIGYTEGPVTLPNGATIATFFSTWRLNDDGRWKVVFDNGYDICECTKKP